MLIPWLLDSFLLLYKSFMLHFTEREIVLRALKDMKEKGVLKSSGMFSKKDLKHLAENNSATVSYQVILKALS